MLTAVAAFLLAFILLLWFVRGGLAASFLDKPNHRSLHSNPTPRIGGLALMSGVLGGWWFVPGQGAGILVPSIVLLMGVSFADDMRSLPAAVRFIAHFLAAGVFIWLSHMYALGAVAVLLMLLAVVWMTNLYNFMDGSDGLAGGMALFGFGFYGLAAWQQGDMDFALLNWTISAAALAFLCFNFHPARIFMGDAGSIPLGFLAAAIGLLGWHGDLWPLWFPALVFSPFVVDATATLCKRLLRGEKVWEAHREHYYQRLVQIGWGHRNTALFEYCAMLLAGGTALWMLPRDHVSQLVVASMLGMLFFLLMVLLDRRWSRLQEDKD